MTIAGMVQSRMMASVLALGFAWAGLAALQATSAVAAEEVISIVKGGSNVGRGRCLAALEYEYSYDKDGITFGRNVPAPGTTMDPPRLESAGVQTVSPGEYRYESLLILTLRRAQLISALPATERRERRIVTCSDSTGVMDMEKVISRVRR
jgi:hypothetical protein